MNTLRKILHLVILFILIPITYACSSREYSTESQDKEGRNFQLVTTQEQEINALDPTQNTSSLSEEVGLPTMSTEELSAAWVNSVYSYKELYKPSISIGQALTIEIDKQLTEEQQLNPLLDIDGNEVKFKGERTLLILGISRCPPCEQLFPLVESWADELGDDLQIVYAVRGRNADGFIQRLEGLRNVRIINDGHTILAAALSARAAPTIFLIGEDEVIRWRMTGFFPQHGLELDKIVRQFAANQEFMTYYWETNFTDPGARPNIVLSDHSGEQREVEKIIADQHTLILFVRNNCPECREILQPVYELAKEYIDKDLQLLIVLDYFTELERELALEYFSTLGIAVEPDVKAFYEHPDNLAEGLQYYSQFLEKGKIQTHLLLDPDSRLSIFWAVTGVPFALFTDKEGNVVDYLPFQWFSQTLEDKPTVGPTLEVLERTLDELLRDSE